MEIQDNTEDIFVSAKEGLDRIINLENEIKDIKETIKEIKAGLKEDGVPLKIFNKAYAYIKKEIKEKKDPEMAEVLQMVEHIKDEVIESKIDNLIFGD